MSLSKEQYDTNIIDNDKSLHAINTNGLKRMQKIRDDVMCKK